MERFEADIQLFIDRFVIGAQKIEASTLRQRTIWLGCGLARLPALYGREIMMGFTDQLARAESLLGLRRMPPRSDELAIMISLRGRHPDSRAIAEYLQRIPNQQAIILTGDADGPACIGWPATDRSILTTALPERDARFINFKGLIVLSAMAGQLFNFVETYSEQDWRHLLYVCCNQGANVGNQISALTNWRDRTIYLVSGASDGMLSRAWASMLGEAGILNPVTVDLLEFTHGDHLAASLRGGSIFIVLTEFETGAACDIFARRFAEIAPTFVLPVASGVHKAYWSNLFTAAATVDQLSVAAGYGGLRPPKTLPVHSWRNWHGS